MNKQDLLQKLTLGSGMLTVARDTLGSPVNELITTYYGGQPIVLTGAQLVAMADSDPSVTVTGKSTFQNVADLPVTATFSIDGSGQVQALLRYQLRDALPGPAAWTFSRSYPKLPEEFNYDNIVSLPSVDAAAGAPVGPRSFLDALDLFETYFVVSTRAAADPVAGVPLMPGINFVSRMRPQGMLGVLEHSLADHPYLVLYGVIYPELPTGTTLALQNLEHAWSRLGSANKPPAPGIYLQAALDLKLTLGGLKFNNAMFRAYSPLTADWLHRNPTFSPLHGYTMTLSIPSANIAVELGADLKWNLPHAILYGQFSGVSLGKLSHLLDLAGTDGLTAHLPEELHKAIEELEKLELMHVALPISLSGMTPTVSSVYLTVGFPNIAWKIWKDDLVVTSLSALFRIDAPFASGTAPAKPEVMVKVQGVLSIEGIPLQIAASTEDQFTVYAATADKVSLPLDKLLKAHGPGIPAPSAMTVNRLSARISRTAGYELTALLAGEPDPWRIGVGKEKLTVSNVSLVLSHPASGSVSGTFGGRICLLDDVVLEANLQVPGSFFMRGSLPPVRLSKVIAKLCNQPVKLPKGLDFDMEYGSIVIQGQQNSASFQIAATIKDFGTVVFEAREAGGAWGFAFGVDLQSVKLSSIPGLSGLSALDKQFHLQKLLLVASSITQPTFQLPDTAQFNNPRLATKKVALPATASGLTAGLNLFAEWTIDSTEKQQKLLSTLLGLSGTEQVTLQIPENPLSGTRLFLAKSGTLMKHPFHYEVGVVVQNGMPSLFLTGTVTAEIHKQPQTFDVTTLFVAGGAFLSADMKGSKPIDLKLFKLANVGLEIGMDWAGIPSLGITATIDVKSFESTVAIFFDSADPSKSLVAGAVSDLTLKEVVDTLLGATIHSPIDGILDQVALRGTHSFAIPASLADDLSQLNLDKVAAAFQSAGKVKIPTSAQQVLLSTNVPGKVWHLTDLTTMRHYQLKRQDPSIVVSLEAQLYFAPQATAIGTITFPQGFFINGSLDILGYHAEATVNIAANKGISVQADMDKIELGKGGLFSLTSADGKTGPRLSLSTMMQPDNPVAEYRLPHFYLSGAVNLLGIKEKALVSLSAKGLLLDLKGTLAPGAVFDLDVQLGRSGLSVDGDVKVGIGTIDLGQLGKVKINTDIEGTLGIRIDAQQIAAFVEASFDLLGEHKQIGKFALDTSPDALTRFADTLKSKAEAVVREEFKDATRWANAVKNGAVEGVADTEKVLQSVYGKSEKEAKAVAGDIGKGVSSAEKTVTKTASSFGKKLKKLF